MKPGIGEILKRGWRCRCPRCGEGPLFIRGIKTYQQCSSCGFEIQRDHGDTWMFIIITDRIPILIGIVVLYFGFIATNWIQATLFFVILIVPTLATLKQRQGLAIALDYLSRRYIP